MDDGTGHWRGMRRSPDMYHSLRFRGISDYELTKELKERGYAVVKGTNVGTLAGSAICQTDDLAIAGIDQHVQRHLARSLGYTLVQQRQYLRFTSEADYDERPAVIFRAAVHVFNPDKAE